VWSFTSLFTSFVQQQHSKARSLTQTSCFVDERRTTTNATPKAHSVELVPQQEMESNPEYTAILTASREFLEGRRDLRGLDVFSSWRLLLVRRSSRLLTLTRSIAALDTIARRSTRARGGMITHSLSLALPLSLSSLLSLLSLSLSSLDRS